MTRRTLTIALSLLAAGSNLVAGPLDPPGGPIGPTMKSLDQVEPRIPITAETCPGDADSLFRITKSGSYYLPGNVTGVAGKHGIEILAGEVTIDLSGHRLQGIAGSHRGIFAESPYHGIVVKDGTVTAWGSSGVDLYATTSGRISGVAAAGNGSYGIIAGSSSVVEHCTATQNGATGINVTRSSTIESCTASLNGDYGFYLDTDSVAERCTATSNGDAGFQVSSGAMVRACTSALNATNGYNLLTHSRVHDSTARANQGYGFLGLSSVVVSGCVAELNDLDGINVNSACRVTDNRSELNGQNGDGAGIRVRLAGVRTLVEGNNAMQNDRGIFVESGANLIIGNTCTLNAVNYDIVAGNRVGTITVLPLSGGINGNTGGDSTGANPISNFAY